MSGNTGISDDTGMDPDTGNTGISDDTGMDPDTGRWARDLPTCLVIPA
jgi:hypothetical protein